MTDDRAEKLARAMYGDDEWKPLGIRNARRALAAIDADPEPFGFYRAAEVDDVLHQVSLVYDHITGSLLSKPDYQASDVITAADDYYNKLVDEALEEAGRGLDG